MTAGETVVSETTVQQLRQELTASRQRADTLLLQLESIIDNSPDPSWMARGLDAEAKVQTLTEEVKTLRAQLDDAKIDLTAAQATLIRARAIGREWQSRAEAAEKKLDDIKRLRSLATEELLSIHDKAIADCVRAQRERDIANREASTLRTIVSNVRHALGDAK